MEQNNIKQQLEFCKSHLVMIKSLGDQEKNDQYCKLIERVQALVGSLDPNIARYYFEYACYLMGRIQTQMDFLNAGAVPQAQQNDGIQEIPQVFDDDSQGQNNGAIQQKKQSIDQNPEKPIYQDNNIQIYEQNQPQKQKIQQKQLTSKKPSYSMIPNKQQINQGQQISQQQQNVNDFQIAYQNFACALNIYQKQYSRLLSGQESIMTSQQIQKYISSIHSRLGDLYMLQQKFNDAIGQYNALIKFQSHKDGSQSNRCIAEAHYMIGNCLLHDNKPNCQVQAISEYIQTVKILVKHMETKYNYDIKNIKIPTKQELRVDRTNYLPYNGDSEPIKDLKQVIGSILDKIQDTEQQRKQREIYQKEKEKISRQKEQNTFKEVPKDVKVTNLGTFGNRKRNPNSQNTNPNQIQQSITMSPKQQIKIASSINPNQIQQKTITSQQKTRSSEQKTKELITQNPQ